MSWLAWNMTIGYVSQTNHCRLFDFTRKDSGVNKMSLNECSTRFIDTTNDFEYPENLHRCNFELLLQLTLFIRWPRQMFRLSHAAWRTVVQLCVMPSACRGEMKTVMQWCWNRETAKHKISVSELQTVGDQLKCQMESSSPKSVSCYCQRLSYRCLRSHASRSTYIDE